MRAYAVYLTHAFVIKRELIPESGAKLRHFDFHLIHFPFPRILENLREGFAADAAFVRWSKRNRRNLGSRKRSCKALGKASPFVWPPGKYGGKRTISATSASFSSRSS